MQQAPIVHEPVELDEDQTKNLRKLADFLSTFDDQDCAQHFNMDMYHQDDAERAKWNPSNETCGTVACAAGWAPVALGWPLEDNSGRRGSSYWASICRQLGAPEWSAPWTWCFAPGWSTVDNTPEGAARRINYMLNHGIPQDLDWEERVALYTPEGV